MLWLYFMLLSNTENRCVLEVLKILSKRQSKYSEMFKKTKVSHTTLQRVLKQLAQKKFIAKHNIGHQNVDYEINEKGKKLLDLLLQLEHF